MAAPEVERVHRVDHAQYALWIFALPLLLSALIEAPIALASDQRPRRQVLAAGLTGLAAALVLCALATAPWVLAIGLALAGAASGVACGVAQAELVTTYPGGPHRAMSRWVAFAAVGDGIAPLLVAVVLWFGGSYRGALAAIAALLALLAVRAWRSAARTSAIERPEVVLEGDGEDAPALPLMVALRGGLREPRLWLFLAASACCLLLDELVIALAGLRLHQELGWSERDVAMIMMVEAAGAVLGALAIEALVQRHAPRALMIGSALGSGVCLGLFIVADTPWQATLALFALGALAAPHYPLVQAAAYEVVPGQPGLVNALAQAFVGLEIAAPLVLGACAERYGLGVALAMLGAQPLAVLLAACALARKRDPASVAAAEEVAAEDSKQ